MWERYESSLLCRVRELLCALPLEHVGEIMRPLAVEPVAGAPPFVQGLAVIRGVAIPVVDTASLLSGSVSHATRFVTIRIGRRRAALAVDAVVGIRRIPPDSLQDLPPLFQNAHLFGIGMLDTEFLLVLQSARLIPDAVWALIEGAAR